ncbi:hypothetical protein HMPREF9057_01720 [Actinomyces sp. oral taxon 171 str. F0337]|nr:hypothetical protein HMPREF9057_01720 [Actinomyces sp. oral taxon 171 str. F0337]
MSRHPPDDDRDRMRTHLNRTTTAPPSWEEQRRRRLERQS